MDWLDLLAVQRTLKSLLQHHSSKASILQRSAFFSVQLSHPYMTTIYYRIPFIWNSRTGNLWWKNIKNMVASVGEGNGNPLQYSCLESPMDRGAWWAAVRGAAKSQTRLKRLSMQACRVLWKTEFCFLGATGTRGWIWEEVITWESAEKVSIRSQGAGSQQSWETTGNPDTNTTSLHGILTLVDFLSYLGSIWSIL